MAKGGKEHACAAGQRSSVHILCLSALHHLALRPAAHPTAHTPQLPPKLQTITVLLPHADHGWRFDNEGTCNTIPQASSDAAEATAAANKRACAVPYPITEAQGMLFVWGEGGAAAMEESRLAAPQTCKLTERTEAAGGSMMTLIKPYTRDLPYSYQGVRRSSSSRVAQRREVWRRAARLPHDLRDSQLTASAHCLLLWAFSPPQTVQLLENIVDPAHGAPRALLGTDAAVVWRPAGFNSEGGGGLCL